MRATLLVLLAFATSLFGQAPDAPAVPDLPRNPAPATTPARADLPTIFIAGDSTAARGRPPRQQGWAVPFADYFDPATVNIVNRARGGRSSRTFITEGAWDQLLALVKKGDIVLIQFGHNDGGPINGTPPAPYRSRGSLPGTGEETSAIDNVFTKRPEVVHTFGWYLRKMIDDVKARGAQPIVLSLTVRNVWRDGHIERGSGRFGLWAYEVARAARVPFLDLTNRMADDFEARGPEAVKALYPQDPVHFNVDGADCHAAAVVAGLKGLRPSPVAEFLSAKGREVAADKFAALRLPFPANPKLPTIYLVGDSTVRTGSGDGARGQWGWGDFLAPAFDLTKCNLCESIASRYDQLGAAAVKPLFADGFTHTTAAGAELNAACVVAALQALPQNPTAPYLRAPASAP